MVIRPFGLTDIPLMRRLQRYSATLAIEHALTHPRAPLWIALTAPWPWAGFGIATYVLPAAPCNSEPAGFVQLMKRATRPEADILYLAPALPAGGERDVTTETLWHALLDHCVFSAAGHGVQRIFASIPNGGPEEACLKDAGFSLYTRETVYRLAVAPTTVASPLSGFRRQEPQDSWALQRLYTCSTPKLVQQAEGAITGNVGTPPLSWWEPDRWQGVVWEPAGEVRGAVQVHLGRAGHWLRLWGANALSGRETRHLIEQGLRLIAGAQAAGKARALPVYATVRDYERDLGAILTGFGFAPFTERVRFVKHTMAPIRVAAAAPALPALEPTQKVVVRSVGKG
ncbi:MAG: hypothetical protein N2439_02745 [Anaerolineae bacterium]|nr:hypothetical protein [Anaerolineae bacterium]